MEDTSSCCSSSLTPPSSPKRPLDLPPFVHRFEDFPEPIRTQMLCASLLVIQKHLDLRVRHVICPSKPTTEFHIADLEHAVAIGKQAGLDIKAYEAILRNPVVRGIKRSWEEEEVERESKMRRPSRYYHVRRWQEEDEEESDNPLEIYE